MSSERALSADAIVAVFDRCFLDRHNTRLRGGAPEPLYEPAAANRAACIWFREDYAASALHEVAHWCIAGSARRQLVDYGYWYAGDGRSAQEQQGFMRVEARPQALEWCFSQAAGLPFRLSLDNLESPPGPGERRVFARAVCAQATQLRDRGFAPRARQFFSSLAEASGNRLTETALRFNPGTLA